MGESLDESCDGLATGSVIRAYRARSPPASVSDRCACSLGFFRTHIIPQAPAEMK
jgi:hypothetical protein